MAAIRGRAKGLTCRRRSAVSKPKSWSTSHVTLNARRYGGPRNDCDEKFRKRWTTISFLLSSCIRLRPLHRNHVWSYDFIEDRTHDGRRFRMLNVIDEFTHECLAIRVSR